MPVMARFTAIRANARVIPGEEIYADLKFYIKDFCDDIVGEVTKYPPVPNRRDDNDYVRTGRYGLYMVARNTSGGGNLQYTIQNPVQDARGRFYAGYVGGPSGQTWFHADTGWPNIRDTFSRKRFDRGVQAIISGRVR